MTQISLSEEEIDRRGEVLYQQLRSKVETNENIGKLISIDTETGDYEIDDDLFTAGKRLQSKHPDAKMVGKRIGYNAVYTVGGMLTRTNAR